MIFFAVLGASGVATVLVFAAAWKLMGLHGPAHGRPTPGQWAGAWLRSLHPAAAVRAWWAWRRTTLAPYTELHHERDPGAGWAIGDPELAACKPPGAGTEGDGLGHSAGPAPGPPLPLPVRPTAAELAAEAWATRPWADNTFTFTAIHEACE